MKDHLLFHYTLILIKRLLKRMSKVVFDTVSKLALYIKIERKFRTREYLQ